MSVPPIPSLHRAKAGQFTTIVAWICGPIVLMELVAYVGVMVFAILVRTEEKTYISTARLLVGGADVNPKLEDGEPIPDAFYATNVELLMSPQVQERAYTQTHVLHREMEPHFVKIKARRLPNTRIVVIDARCEDGPYGRAVLDTLMDEFLIFRKELKSKGYEEQALVMQDELVRLEKEMQVTEQKMKDIEWGNADSADLDKAKEQMKKLKESYDTIRPKLRRLDDLARGTPEVFSILERASPGMELISRDFSFFGLSK